MSDTAKIKERIQNLLAVAENDASTENEVTTAFRIAEGLMRKHNLSRDDIEAKSDGTFDVDSVEYTRQSVTMVGIKRTRWEMSLARFLAFQFVSTCKFYYNTSQRRKEPNGTDVDGRMFGSTVTFYGPAADVQLCCELFRDMGLRIQHYGQRKFGGYARGEGGTYCEGFVFGLSEANRRVRRDNLEDKTATPSEHALILADQQLKTQLAARATTWLTELPGVKLRSGTSLSGASGSSRAYNAGAADGRRTSLSSNRPSRIS